MPIRFDQNFGLYIVTDAAGNRLGTARSPEEARALESSGAGKTTTPTNQEFGRVTGNQVATGQGASGGGMGLANQNRRSMLGADAYATDQAKNLAARNLRAEQERLSTVAYGTGRAQGGTAANTVATQGTGVGGTTQQGPGTVQTAVDTGNRYVLNADKTVMTDPVTGQPIVTGPDGQPIKGATGINGAPEPTTPGGGPNGDIDYALSEATGYVEGDNDTQGIIDRVDEIISGAELERDAGGKAQVDQALAAQQSVIDRVLSQESDARIIAEQMAAEQRGQALSARGGAAAQQQAMTQVAANAPALQQAAFRTANQETTQRNALAGQVAGQMGDVALGSEQNDIRIQEVNAGMADSFAKMVATLGGVELNLNAADRHKVGQMVFDFQMLTQNTDLGWANLSVEEKGQILDYMLGKYSVDTTTAAQIKMTAMNNEESFLDQLAKLGGVGAALYSAGQKGD